VTRLSHHALREMRALQRKADASRTAAYSDAKRLLDATRDVEGAEAMYVATCARISAEETVACDRLMAEALALLERELGRKPVAYDIRALSRRADEEDAA
jgi:hypothetical protein